MLDHSLPISSSLLPSVESVLGDRPRICYAFEGDRPRLGWLFDRSDRWLLGTLEGLGRSSLKINVSSIAD